jgi:hypothetical protein
MPDPATTAPGEAPPWPVRGTDTTAPRLESVHAQACTIPTDEPESDGTLAWDHTTIIIVQAHAAGCTGIGYTYTSPPAARLVNELLSSVVVGLPAG